MATRLPFHCRCGSGIDDEGGERCAAGTAEPDGLGQGIQRGRSGFEVVGVDGVVLKVSIADGVRVDILRSSITYTKKGGELIEG